MKVDNTLPKETTQNNSNSLEVIDLENSIEPQIYSNEEAMKYSLEYFGGDELAANVWINKYALKNNEGKLLEKSPDDMHQRLAREIARIEAKYPNSLSPAEIYELLKDFSYIIPQGGSMSGIGNNYQVSSLSNCFVIGNNADSYGGIMQTDEEQAQLMKRRGGVGHDLSHIRPHHSPVKNNARTSTGIVPFMERFSNSTREVAQDGRRGALMLSIDVKHPDVEDFIDAKLEKGKITGANISVKINDAFMDAVEKNENYFQAFPVKSNNENYKIEANARKIWDKLVKNAWKSAEPGILFWDTVIRESIPDCYSDKGYQTVSTNPCGEIPLCPYDSCRLLAINLYSYVDNPFTENATFDFHKFEKHSGYAQRIMDDIIDLEIEKINAILDKVDSDPEPSSVKQTEKSLWEKIKEKCIEGRRMGLGITAEGDMLAALGMTYGSDKAIDFATDVHRTLALSAYSSSVELAKERGPFEIYDSSREEDNPFIERIKKADPELYERMVRYGRRNIALLTIAPTGTTSLMSQTSSGIEPAFLISYKRRKKINQEEDRSASDFVDQSGDHWEEYNVFHHKFLEWLQIQNIDSTRAATLSNDELKTLIAQSPFHKATSNEIDWIQKVKMQGAIQKWVDHSISVTVNLPNEAPVELVNELMITAWKVGCKGITIYRDGSRDGVLISSDDNKEKDGGFVMNRPPQRPDNLKARVIRFNNQDEKWIAVVGLLENKPYEIFTGRAEDIFRLPNFVNSGVIIKAKSKDGNRYDFQYTDKEGYKTTIEGLSRSFNKEFWNYAKLISGVLRHGMPLQFVVDLVARLNYENAHIHSWANGVTRALKIFVPNGTTLGKASCEACGEKGGLSYTEGCLICNHCGHSKCN